MPEITQNIIDDIQSASQAPGGLERGSFATIAMLPAALGSKKAARRFAGNRNPYWAMRGAATGAATKDILGPQALPVTPENQAIIEALNEFYTERGE